jgi:hypothetical protein
MRHGRYVVDVVVVPWSTLMVDSAFLGKIPWDCMVMLASEMPSVPSMCF